jgi:quinol monooxygenase YgiN
MVMHARVVSATMVPGQEEKLRRILNEVIVPAAQEQTGFRGALTLLDRGTGKGMMITLWASAEDLVASEASGYITRQIAAVAPILRGAAVRETYEVELSADAGSPMAEPHPVNPPPAT